MPKFVIERDIPGAHELSARDLQAISLKSNRVLKDIGPQIQWLHSYVTENKLYCVYISPDEATIRQHAKQGEFPVTRISRLGRMIDPTTAEG